MDFRVGEKVDFWVRGGSTFVEERHWTCLEERHWTGPRWGILASYCPRETEAGQGSRHKVRGTEALRGKTWAHLVENIGQLGILIRFPFFSIFSLQCKSDIIAIVFLLILSRNL